MTKSEIATRSIFDGFLPRARLAKVTRDMKNPRRGSSRGGSKKKVGFGLLFLLGAVNVGVFLYHGDPRERARAAAPHQDPQAESPRPRASQRRAEAKDARLPAVPWQDAGAFSEFYRTDVLADADSDIEPWANPGLDSLLGLRTPGPEQRVEVVQLKSGQTVAAALANVGASPQDLAAAIQALQTLVDFRRIRAGHTLKARLDDTGRLLSLGIHQSIAESVEATRTGDVYKAVKVDVPIETVVANVSGSVQSTLWEAIAGRGEEPALIADFADVFAWEVDFFRDVRVGDSYRMLVEKRYARGKLVGYGRVLAAEYVNDGTSHRAFYHVSGGTGGYYADTGESCKKLLLKMPLQYGRMTSGFGSRHHPVLGYTRAHNGVDYGVPVGTPVWAVGDGRVVKAGYGSGFGNLVEVAHSNGWTSQYAHLSAIAVRVGQHVSQKQTIARSGNTGLSTGPHLHYGLKQHDHYVNPASQKFERAEPLKGAELQAFKQEIERLSAELDRITVASL
jgi:murein DD-endopeptidase MepM/ murein hydrolase activator NlpD